jgi:hypothetical protein
MTVAVWELSRRGYSYNTFDIGSGSGSIRFDSVSLRHFFFGMVHPFDKQKHSTLTHRRNLFSISGRWDGMGWDSLQRSSIYERCILRFARRFWIRDMGLHVWKSGNLNSLTVLFTATDNIPPFSFSFEF